MCIISNSTAVEAGRSSKFFQVSQSIYRESSKLFQVSEHLCRGWENTKFFHDSITKSIKRGSGVSLDPPGFSMVRSPAASSERTQTPSKFCLSLLPLPTKSIAGLKLVFSASSDMKVWMRSVISISCTI